MTQNLFWFIPLAIIVTALATIVIRSHHHIGIKWAGVALVALWLPISYLSLNDLLSRPKPVTLEFLDFDTLTVIASQSVEDESIYLWLQMDDGPRSYVMPWSESSARQLHEAKRASEGEGGTVTVDNLFDGNGGESVFHSAPVQALPEKVVE